MTLIAPLEKNAAQPEVKQKLEFIEEKYGRIPNLPGIMAHSKVTLNMFMSMEGALSAGELSPTQREMIALAVSQANECKYCVSAHTEFCSGLGLDTAVPEDQLASFREDGLSNSLILETFSNVINMMLANYVNHLARTEIDFPVCTLDL